MAKEKDKITVQKRDKPNPYWMVGYLLFIVIAVIAVILFNDATSFTQFLCHRGVPSQDQRVVYNMELLIILSVIAIVISILLKLDSRRLFIVFSLLTFLMVFWSVITFLSEQITSCPATCTIFQKGFGCTWDELHPNGELDLSIFQETGHTIKITGVTCTQNASHDYVTKANINNYASDPIIINSDGIVSRSGTSHTLMCTDENGKPLNGKIGFWYGNEYINRYNGRIFINYTDMEMNISRVAAGSLNREPTPTTPSCWVDPFYCVVGMNNTLFPLLIVVWCALGIYLFLKLIFS